MPKSRGRKSNKKQRGRTTRSDQQRTHRASTARVQADCRILRATDEAEARGDARAALQVVEQDLRLRRDDNFWRPEKIERLIQMDVLGPVLPRWATSRWILAQAAQWLDEDNRARTADAFSLAFRVGGFDPSRYRSDFDLRTKVMDHNWVFRQAFLYDLGGLRHFVDEVASPDLVAGADDLADWPGTPLGGFQLLEETPRVLTWFDLRERVEVETPNIGSATLLEPGDCAIGRLQPVREGWIFDCIPLYVPQRVAQQVADEPADWVTTLGDLDHATPCDGRGVCTNGHDFRLLTDVPQVLQHLLLADVEETVSDRRVTDAAEILPLEVGLVRAAMDGLLGDDIRGLSPWPTVGATVLRPRALRSLLTSARTGDANRLREVARRLADPAARVCRDLAAELEVAA